MCLAWSSLCDRIVVLSLDPVDGAAIGFQNVILLFLGREHKIQLNKERLIKLSIIFLLLGTGTGTGIQN